MSNRRFLGLGVLDLYIPHFKANVLEFGFSWGPRPLLVLRSQVEAGDFAMRVWLLARAPGRQRLGNKARLVNCRKRWAEICPRADGRGHPRRFRATSRQYRLCVSIGGMVAWQDTLSEWLRRWTRNPLGSARRGSNPLGVALPGPSLIPARCFTSTVKGGLALIPATPGTRPRQYARASSIV